MSSRPHGRHRSPVPARTPLSVAADVFTAHAATVGRRTAVIAASSGLVVSMGVSVADAAPVASRTTSTVAAAEPVAQPAARPAAPAARSAATPVLAAVPVVSVAVDAPVTLARPVLPAAVPPPPPPPPPPVVEEDEERSTPAASRSRARTSVEEESEEEAPTASRTSSRSSEPAAEPAPATANADGIRGEIIATAKQYLGIPYLYGGTTTSGFDCSGFTQFVYGKVGISLPRTSGAQSGAGTRVSRSEAQPGDLVWKPGHIGIYAGGNMMIDSPSSGGVTSVREMWSSDFQFIRVI